MKQKIFRILADLRFSIFILLLISGFSILGTIIEQDQPIEVYKLNYPISNPIFGFLSWDLIFKLGLDHIYQTWWFLTAILLFGISLILCSFLQQLPSLKIARRCQFFRTTNQFYRLKISTILTDLSFNKILTRIYSQKYSIFQQNNIIYCYKGLIGRLAPIIVHFSMILILFGTIVGACFGFKGQESIPNTETFHIQNLLNQGSFTIVPKLSTRINDFWITYTQKRTIAQFYSDLSVLDQNGNEKSHKTISVNLPLISNNIYYYQTNWDFLGLRIQLENNKIKEYPLLNISNDKSKISISWIENNQNAREDLLLLTDNLEGYCSIYNREGQLLETIEINELTRSLSNSFSFLSFINSTGLQIKTDPGIPIIYFGFFCLILSTLISYITYSQIWLIQKNTKIFIGGNTNRDIFNFELEFLRLVK